MRQPTDPTPPPRPDRSGRDPAVVVVAGGRARRFGADKVALLLDGLLLGLPAGWPVVCVGPWRPTVRAVRWAREDPPFAGPLAAVGAGVRALAAAGVAPRRILVLAADMPRAPLALAALVAACDGDAGAACLVDGSGARQPLLACYDAHVLTRVLEAAVPLAGRPARLLLAGPGVREVADRWGAGQDVDRPTDLAAGCASGASEPVQPTRRS